MCDCRKVRLRLHGTCEAATICHCAECQTAAVVFENQFNRARSEPGGGTTFAIWRKDRVDCVMGADHLAGHRLTDDTPSRRVIATCCGTPMFIDRKGRPWVGLFADRLPPDRRPAPRWRTFCKDLARRRPATGSRFRGIPAIRCNWRHGDGARSSRRGSTPRTCPSSRATSDGQPPRIAFT